MLSRVQFSRLQTARWSLYEWRAHIHTFLFTGRLILRQQVHKTGQRQQRKMEIKNVRIKRQRDRRKARWKRKGGEHRIPRQIDPFDINLSPVWKNENLRHFTSPLPLAVLIRTRFYSKFLPLLRFKMSQVLLCCNFVPTSSIRESEEGLNFLWIRNEPWICKSCSHWARPTGSRGIKQQEVSVST